MWLGGDASDEGAGLHLRARFERQQVPVIAGERRADLGRHEPKRRPVVDRMPRHRLAEEPQMKSAGTNQIHDGVTAGFKRLGERGRIHLDDAWLIDHEYRGYRTLLILTPKHRHRLRGARAREALERDWVRYTGLACPHWQERRARVHEPRRTDERPVLHATARHRALFEDVFDGTVRRPCVVAKEVPRSVRGAVRRRSHLTDPRKRPVRFLAPKTEGNGAHLGRRIPRDGQTFLASIHLEPTHRRIRDDLAVVQPIRGSGNFLDAGIGPPTSIEGVRAVAAAERVVATTANQGVVSVLATQCIGSRATQDLVVAWSSVDGVVPSGSLQIIISIAPVDEVTSGAPA